VLHDLLLSTINFWRFNWLPGLVAEYNAAEKRKDEIDKLKQQILDAQSRLAEAEYKNDRIEKKLDSWYRPS